MLAGQGWYVVFEMPQSAIIMECLVPIVGVIAGSRHEARSGGAAWTWNP